MPDTIITMTATRYEDLIKAEITVRSIRKIIEDEAASTYSMIDLIKALLAAQ